MKMQRLGSSELVSTRLAYGCMRIVGTWNPAEITPEKREVGFAALKAAYEAGYNLFDHADIYCSGECEKLHGELLKSSPDLRRSTIIATKCGIRNNPHRYDFSGKHIIWSAEQALQRLGVETIDLFQLHRPDLLMEPEEVHLAFLQLHREGKVRYFGVSNFLPSFVEALRKGGSLPLVVNQVEIHMGRLDPFKDGTLDQCLDGSITPLSWSPFGGGWLAGTQTLPDTDPRAHIQKELNDYASKLGTSAAHLALAFLLHHPSKIVPIVGSTKPERIKEMVSADQIELTREMWYDLWRIGDGKPLP